MGFIPSVRTDLVEKREQVIRLALFFLEAPPRFGLGVKVLQTAALPLGYGALIWEIPHNKKMERETRFELATFALARQRSTTEPFPQKKGESCWWEQ